MTASVGTLTVTLVADARAFQRTIGEKILPAVERLANVWRHLYNSLPGMPYTAPSLWDASQMTPDR